MKPRLLAFLFFLGAILTTSLGGAETSGEQRLLYVATPGVRDYLEYGGHGILVFDINHDHRFVRRIKASGLTETGKPLNVKGICASADTGRLYVSTTRTMTCYDLNTDKILWEKSYGGGCDRMSISPDGKTIYLPSFEGPHWHVVDARSGETIKRVIPNSRSHNTVYGRDGRRVYLAGLGSPFLSVAETTTHTTNMMVGPFSAFIRPFTVNAAQTLCFVNVNELLGFEIGDLKSGKMLHRVEVKGFEKGPTKRHGCPSHGIGLTPDEKEIWVTDAANSQLHIFDNSTMPPRQIASLHLRDQPGWITFTIDGRLAYPSTGEVIDTRTRKIIATLHDEKGGDVQSEKLLEIDFRDHRPVRAGDQFGIGRPGLSPK